VVEEEITVAIEEVGVCAGVGGVVDEVVVAVEVHSVLGGGHA
jgi:hypothetical protein